MKGWQSSDGRKRRPDGRLSSLSRHLPTLHVRVRPGESIGRRFCRKRMIIHLIDGTYELFRHFYGLRRFHKGEDRPFGAVIGVLHTVLQMIETGATHVGVATDHVIESFRNRIWSGYKTGDGIERALLAPVPPARRRTRCHGSGRVADD